MKCFIFLSALLSMSAAMECPAVSNPTKLPALDPIQFSYFIEISIEDTRQTLDAYEFYDHENDTVSLFVDKSYGSNHTNDAMRTSVTYDYKYNQTFIVDRMQGSSRCRVEDLNATLPHQPTLFGVGIENGPWGVKYAFHWNSTQNFTLVGTEIVQGIETNHYNVCIPFENGTLLYFIDIYFSVGNWSMPAGQNAPVLLTLNAMNQTDNTSSVYNYKFSDYHTSQTTRMWRPHKPGDMICPGRKDVPDFPLGNHSRYSLDVEVLSSSRGRNFLFDSSTYVDYERKLVMYDMKAIRKSRSVINFRQGLMYRMNGTTGSCNITPIALHSIPFLFALTDNNTQVQMQTYFDPRKAFNLTYGGITHHKEILAHSWISQQGVVGYDFADRVENASWYVTYYFSVQKIKGKNVLVGMKETIVAMINSSTVTHVIPVDVYNEQFDFNPRVFDISGCFNDAMRSTVVLKFSSDFQNEVNMYPMNFQNALIAEVAKQSGLDDVRVTFSGSYQTTNQSAANNHDSKGIYVYVTLLGVPDVKGDSADMTPQVNLSDGLASLKKVVNDDSFIISFMGSKPNSMGAYHDYFETQDSLLQPNKPPAPKPASQQSGISNGAAAGLAVGMVVLGMLLGYGLYHCRSGRLRSQYAYSMQS